MIFAFDQFVISIDSSFHSSVPFKGDVDYYSRNEIIFKIETKWKIEFPCRKIWSSRWLAEARNIGSQCWLSILDRWSIEAWMIIAGLYWLVIYIGPKIGPDDMPRITAEFKLSNL